MALFVAGLFGSAAGALAPGPKPACHEMATAAGLPCQWITPAPCCQSQLAVQGASEAPAAVTTMALPLASAPSAPAWDPAPLPPRIASHLRSVILRL